MGHLSPADNPVLDGPPCAKCYPQGGLNLLLTCKDVSERHRMDLWKTAAQGLS